MLFEKLKSIVGNAAELELMSTDEYRGFNQVSILAKTPNFRGIIVIAELKTNDFMFSFSAMESDAVEVKTIKSFEVKEFMSRIGVEEQGHRAYSCEPLPCGVAGGR